MLNNQEIKMLIRLVREEIKRTQNNKYKHKDIDLYEIYVLKEKTLYSILEKLRSLIK